MQQLHLVGITTELDGLIFSTRRGSRAGSFIVPITEELLDSIGQAEKLRREAEPDAAADETASAMRRLRSASRPESRLTPREMQARLRAGQSVAQVARAAAVGEEWVDRFAAPILAEQARVLEMAYRLPVTSGRLGPSAMALSESVRVNLHDRGVPLVPEPVGWSAHNLGSGRWAVRYEYVSRRRRQVAEWDLDLDRRELTARNRLAADIGHVASLRRRVPMAPTVVVPAADDAAPPRRPASPRARSRRPAPRKALPRKAQSRKAQPRKAVPKKAVPRKALAKKAVTKKAVPKRAPAKKVVAKKKAASRKKAAVTRRAAPRRRGR